MEDLFFSPIQIKCECEHKVTNICGRECCNVYGKLNCEWCLQPAGNTGWAIVEGKEVIFVNKPPVKSSLGWLYGYPTKVTQNMPTPFKIRRQGTSSRIIPPRYRVKRW